MQYRLNTYAKGVWDTFWFEKNLHGDIVTVYNTSGVKCISYVYDAWGRVVKNTLPYIIDHEYINDVDYLYNHFANWAFSGKFPIGIKASSDVLGSGFKLYKRIWGWYLGGAK